jgi:DNA-binding NarL/FixJ family response regulator
MIKVTIVEDNPQAAALLTEIIEKSSMQVIARYASAEAVLEDRSLVPPDIFLVDIGLPGMSGIMLTRKLKTTYPHCEIVMQTVFEEAAQIIDAIKAGASGYLLKGAPREEIAAALLEVKKGGSYLSGPVARKVLNEFKSLSLRTIRSDDGKQELTIREKEVLERLVAGDSYKTIADRLGISIHTVNNHLRHIYEKLQVSSRAEVVSKFIRL